MTDKNIADKIYIEPLTLTTVKRIIEKERPDSILSGLGGQTGLTRSVQLAKEGFLDKMGIRLLGSLPETIEKAGQLRVEKSVAGWKEIEFEVMRDAKDNAAVVCVMENFDPVGVHTGDSIAVAPAVSLNEKELQMLRKAALGVVRLLGIEGGCNVRFALHPYNMDYAVIAVGLCASRSCALASKATGYPIAKVSTKIAIGYTLDEMVNQKTGKTYAEFEPELDYFAVKLPKFPFEELNYANREPGTQMKATGEVMALADTFEAALLKAVRGAQPGFETLISPGIAEKTDTELREMLESVTGERLFVLYEAIRRGFNIDDIYMQTRVDKFFLRALENIAAAEQSGSPTWHPGARVIYKTVDSCTADFNARSPYFYSIIKPDTPINKINKKSKNEALAHIAKSVKQRIIVLGSGPVGVWQGAEFDYAGVYSAWTLMEMGYEVIVINNNPETVLTDFDTADRLYFEPLHIEDVMRVIEIEKPLGVIVAYGGSTAIKLTSQLRERGVNIIGTSAESINACGNREYLCSMLEKLGVPRIDEAMADEYLQGLEIDVDAIFDGTDLLIPGIMENTGRTGGSIAIYPAIGISDELAGRIFEVTKKLCAALEVKGIVNIRYFHYENELYVIEVNPRASRTAPYISKVTGIPMCEISTKVSIGMMLADMGYSSGFGKLHPYIAVKVPVFPLEELPGLDTHLESEMKSAGDVPGIGKNLEEALYKGLVAAGYDLERKGGVLLTVRDSDKEEIADVAGKLWNCGLTLYATRGTADFLSKKGYRVHTVEKIHESNTNTAETLIESGKVSYVINTTERGRDAAYDDVKLRRKAYTLGIPYLTAACTANALAEILLSGYNEMSTELIDIVNLRSEHKNIEFVKMHGCGNDYIYINCFDMEINSPESLAVLLSDRHTGIGGDGVVLIMRSETADAKMRMFNIDGSEGGMCGNAIRCIGKYLFDNGIVKTLNISIETLSGIKNLYLSTRNGKVSMVKVDMEPAELLPSKIPVTLAGESVINRPVTIGGKEYKITCVSMGNPHAVVFCEGVDSIDLETVGPQFENNKIFPDRVNAGFVEVLGNNRLKVRVWERGSGITRACGTGACAAAVAAVLNGYCEKGTDIRVRLPGGELVVNYTDETVTMTGDAVTVYKGVVEV